MNGIPEYNDSRPVAEAFHKWSRYVLPLSRNVVCYFPMLVPPGDCTISRFVNHFARTPIHYQYDMKTGTVIFASKS